MAGMGSTIGSLAGGAIGSALLPGVGTAIGSSLGGMIGGKVGSGGKSSGGGASSGTGSAVGAGMGIATGLLQQFQANKLKKQADSAFPSLVDPAQAGFLAELDQKRRSIETGAAFQSGMDAIDETNAGTNAAIVKTTGGDVGSTIQSLLQAQRGAAGAKNQVLAQGQSKQFQYDSLYKNMMDQISARQLQLQMAKSGQARAEWASKQQGASQNLQAGMAGLLSGGGSAGATAPADGMVPVDKSALMGAIGSQDMASMDPGNLPVNDISNVPLAGV